MAILVVTSELDIHRILESVRTLNVQLDDFIVLIEDLDQLNLNLPSTYFVNDFADHANVNSVLRKIGQEHPIKTVISSDEFSVHVAARARETYGIPGMNCDVARRYRDKLVMKKIAEHNNIAVSQSFAISDLKENTVDFPLIIKPRSLAGAVGVLVIQSFSDIPERCTFENSMFVDMDPSQYIIEQYNPNKIVHVDIIVSRKNIIFITASMYEGTPLAYLRGEPLASISIEKEHINTIWLQFAQKLNIAFQFPDGVLHIEAFANETTEPQLLEIGYRPGGGPVVDVLNIAYGINLRTIHLAAQLGHFEKLTALQTETTATHAWLIYPKNHTSDHPQYIDTIQAPSTNSLSTLKSMSLPIIGQKASGEFYSHQDCLGSFIFIGTREDVISDIKKIRQQYKVIVRSEKNKSY
jgi:hypothetical protein